MSNWRAVSAIVAIYAIAIQGVLALAAPARATAIAVEAGTLCKTGDAGPSDTARVDDLCAKCLAGHCGSLACGRIAGAVAWPRHVDQRAPKAQSAAPALVRSARQFARAPPAA